MRSSIRSSVSYSRFQIDGADPAALLSTAETDMDFITERHLANISLFTKWEDIRPLWVSSEQLWA